MPSSVIIVSSRVGALLLKKSSILDLIPNPEIISAGVNKQIQSKERVVLGGFFDQVEYILTHTRKDLLFIPLKKVIIKYGLPWWLRG